MKNLLLFLVALSFSSCSLLEPQLPFSTTKMNIVIKKFDTDYITTMTPFTDFEWDSMVIVHGPDLAEGPPIPGVDLNKTAIQDDYNRYVFFYNNKVVYQRTLSRRGLFISPPMVIQYGFTFNRGHYTFIKNDNLFNIRKRKIDDDFIIFDVYSIPNIKQ